MAALAPKPALDIQDPWVTSNGMLIPWHHGVWTTESMTIAIHLAVIPNLVMRRCTTPLVRSIILSSSPFANGAVIKYGLGAVKLEILGGRHMTFITPGNLLPQELLLGTLLRHMEVLAALTIGI